MLRVTESRLQSQGAEASYAIVITAFLSNPLPTSLQS